MIDAENVIKYLNNMGEQFLQASAVFMTNQHLESLVPLDSPLFGLIEQVRNLGNEVIEYGVPLESPRIGKHLADIQASSLPNHRGGLSCRCRNVLLPQKSTAN